MTEYKYKSIIAELWESHPCEKYEPKYNAGEGLESCANCGGLPHKDGEIPESPV